MALILPAWYLGPHPVPQKLTDGRHQRVRQVVRARRSSDIRRRYRPDHEPTVCVQHRHPAHLQVVHQRETPGDGKVGRHRRDGEDPAR